MVEFRRIGYGGRMKAWRYIESKYADSAVALGCFRIGTLSGYASLEDELCDPMDGAVERQLDHLHIKDSNLDPLGRAIAERTGFEIHNSHNITISGVTFREHSGAHYCMCLSDIPDNMHLLDQGRDAVLEILDVNQFAKVIAGSSGRFTGRYRIDNVQYKDRKGDARRFDLNADPFVKSPKFRPEREIRILWEPTEENVSPFNVISTQLVGLISRVA